jgi:short-subunit dehydrogenase
MNDTALNSNPTQATQGRTALITGASTGIGATYADRLAARGYDLILVARSQDKLQALAAQLHNRYGVQAHVLAADLTQEAGLQAVEAVLREDARIDLLVNNAGAARMAPLAALSADSANQQLTLNIVAPTRLSHAVVPQFLQRQRGALINIASVTSQMVRPGNSVYGGTKAYLLHFSQVLAAELADAGIRVQAVLPGVTRTPLWNDAPVGLDQIPEAMIMEVGEMVDAALAGFDQGETVTIPSLPDPADWDRLVAAREQLQPNLSHRHAATRYAVAAA